MRTWDSRKLPPAGKRSPAEKHNTPKETAVGPTAKREDEQESQCSRSERTGESENQNPVRLQCSVIIGHDK